jgi:glycerol-3-phosphate dehydrogenase
MLGQRPNPSSLTAETWDLIVIGGGITGAGVLLEAARRGHRVLLLEQRDFAWGTSSRSSKMVHGGLRYLGQGDIRLTRHSLLERERLLKELPDMVIRQPYLFPIRRGRFPGRWPMKAVLWLYDFLAGIRDHRWLSMDKLLTLVPGLSRDGLVGAMRYTDALTDDSRLVARVLHEGCGHGGQACNYVEVGKIASEGGLLTVSAKDLVGEGASLSFRARHVINATGAWADRLSGTEKKVRPQRGSHLFVPAERLPITDCLTILHPDDGRPVFVFPWEGRTCIGTTDLDHRDDLSFEPWCTRQEVDYLLKLVNSQFPKVALQDADIISTMAGVRPIIASGKGVDPSKERRDHAVWEKDGVVTVSGGKLTTFRLIALDALLASGLIDAADHGASQAPAEAMFRFAVAAPHRLGHPLAAVPQGNDLLEQIQWVLDNEMVVHLDDLLLRRTRVGNLLPSGAEAQLDAIKPLCQQTLGWDDAEWEQEVARYQDIVARYYGLPQANSQPVANAA